MKKVSLKKVPAAHLQVLQDEVLNYANGFTEYLKKPEEYTQFYYSVQQVDIANRLWFFLRPRIESGQPECSFSLKVHEAVVLLNACSNASVLSSDDYTRHVAEVHKGEIDNQLKSINITI